LGRVTETESCDGETCRGDLEPIRKTLADGVSRGFPTGAQSQSDEP